jgi:[ribosomal protein S5]-alanine N-acetyltransferase
VAPIFETERLFVRAPTPDDVHAFHSIWGDPAVIWWGGTTRDEADAARQIAAIREANASSPGLGRWLAYRRSDGACVGHVMLKRAPFVEGVELGYHFATAYQGRGYATEAARGAVRYGFDVAGLATIFAAVVPDNRPSKRVLEKVGFRYVRNIVHADRPHELWSIER